MEDWSLLAVLVFNWRGIIEIGYGVLCRNDNMRFHTAVKSGWYQDIFGQMDCN
jgi:hypothetical protein